jgi:hypothetical protein
MPVSGRQETRTSTQSQSLSAQLGYASGTDALLTLRMLMQAVATSQRKQQQITDIRQSALVRFEKPLQYFND